MSINDIECKECSEEFSWFYREDLVKHEHKVFRFFVYGVEYELKIKEKSS